MSFSLFFGGVITKAIASTSPDIALHEKILA